MLVHGRRLPSETRILPMKMSPFEDAPAAIRPTTMSSTVCSTTRTVSARFCRDLKTEA